MLATSGTSPGASQPRVPPRSPTPELPAGTRRPLGLGVHQRLYPAPETCRERRSARHSHGRHAAAGACDNDGVCQPDWSPTSRPRHGSTSRFGKPLDVYNLTGTAKARITVATLTRHDQPTAPGGPGSYISAIVTVDALTGTWMTSGYQMRLDTTNDSTPVSVRRSTLTSRSTSSLPELAYPQATVRRPDTPQPARSPSPRHRATMTCRALSICPAEPQCYDLGLWTTRP